MSASYPPGPSSPSLIQVARYLTRPLAFFEECARRYGDVFTLNLGAMGRWVFVWSPALVKEVFQAGSDVLTAGEAKARIFGEIVGTGSSLVLDGEAHLRRRKLLLPAFHGDRMLVYTDVLRDLTLRELSSWKPHEERSLHKPLQRIALSAILEAIFGIPASEQGPMLALMNRLSDDAIGSPALMFKFLQHDLGPRSPWGKLRRVVREVDVELRAEIARRRAQAAGERPDILSMLLVARNEDGSALSDSDLRDELVTMVAAGHEITGLSLSWAVGAIISRPEVYQRVLDELTQVLGGGLLTREHLPRLKVLEATIKESLRLYSAVANGSARSVIAPWKLGNYTLEPGTTVSVCIHALHRRPELYPDPEAFVPDRFLGKSANPYEWVPFGGGIRRCLGMAFALHEMKVVIATLLSRVRLKLAQPRIEARRRGAFMAPGGGPKVGVLASPAL